MPYNQLKFLLYDKRVRRIVKPNDKDRAEDSSDSFPKSIDEIVSL